MSFTSDHAAPGLPPSSYATEWTAIDALLQQQQSVTAAPLVEAICQKAKKDGNDPAYVRALLYKVRLLQASKESADEKSIALLELELTTATFPARPILHSLLAEQYANYLRQNRYIMYRRTAGAAPTTDGQKTADGSTSLATWDVGRLGATIVRHYYQSVEDEPQRQLQTTLADLGDLAVGGDAEGRALRPTLYDLLAQRAIEGLKNQELYVTKPEQQFQLTEPKLFGTAAEFAALRLLAPEADSLNGQLHALHLLQRLTAARQQLTPPNLAALADVDLSRLDYLHSLTRSKDLATQYEPALVRMAETYRALPISTEFMARRAAAEREAGDNVAAVKLTHEAEARFPKSRGVARARRLRESIEQVEVAFSAADIIIPNQPWRLDVTARNAGELHAWAYRISLREWEKSGEYDEKKRTVAQRYARALRVAPAATWVVPVPEHSQDYKEQKFAAAGAALPIGHYLVIISTQAAKPTEQQPDAVLSYQFIIASELSAVNRREADTGTAQLLVLHRQSGAALAGVKIQPTYRYYDQEDSKWTTTAGAIATTKATGEVLLPAALKADSGELYHRSSIDVVRIWRGSDTLLIKDISSYYGPDSNQPKETPDQTFLFTDRAIYRPGQTLYFKGIHTEIWDDKARILTRKRLDLRLVDVNDQTVETLQVITSDFGSFDGSLVLPTSLLNGTVSLQTKYGSVRFAVEDYKRPTFLVTLDSVPGRPELGQPLTLNGQARAYAGQATDGATVSYRITRGVLVSPFENDEDYHGGYNPWTPGGKEGSQEIAHGTTTTDAEGRFSLTFTPLLPERHNSRRNRAGYLFAVTADVTDAAGETRTGTRDFPIGHNSLSLRLVGPKELDKQLLPEIKLLSTNTAGQLLPTAGTLRLLALCYRPNLPGVPGLPPETIENEAPLELLKTLPFDTKVSSSLDLNETLELLPNGRYRLEALVTGADTVKLDFTLYDSWAAIVPFATPDWFVVLADTVAPGQSLEILLGSDEDEAHILLEVEREGRLLRQEWLTLSASAQRRISIESGPAKALGPLCIHTLQVYGNRLYRHTATVQVAEKPQPLQLSIATFRDKLQPGQKETWRVTIHQANGQAAEAELLATLYDQSLDIFRPHRFAELIFGRKYYSAKFGWRGDFTGSRSFPFVKVVSSPKSVSLEYPQLNTWQAKRTQLDERRFKMGIGGQERGVSLNESEDGAMAGFGEIYERESSPPPPAAAVPDLSSVPTRSDFRETAFWQPALRTDENGDIVLEFQMPEAVTRWQLLALAHDKALHTGQLARQLVTQKEIQITPNAPRFLRPGDTFTFPAKFSNLTDHATTGTAQLFLLDAATGQDITTQLLKGPAQQSVSAAAHQSAALGWEIALPGDFAPVAVTYRVVASSSRSTVTDENGKELKAEKALAPDDQQLTTAYTDGEENTLPVLPNRVLITESLPLPIVGPGTREFELKKLTSTSSPTRRNYSLTLEMTANPAWYAVQSLPYLMEYPYECSEQVFSRVYANLIAAHILKSNPRFKTVLAEWKHQAQGSPAPQKNAFESKLAQNQELKNLLLQETPWVRDAQGETARLVRFTELFDEVRIEAETSLALRKLLGMQQPTGGFPWFEQMPISRYITQLIVVGFGKLKKLGAFDAESDAIVSELLKNTLRYVDDSLAKDYAELRKQKGVKLADNHLGDEQIQALYARSYWPSPPETDAARTAFDYYRGQAATYWPAQTRYLQAQLSLSLCRHDATSPAAQQILHALTENALHSPELGMYWKEVRGGYYWREAPTETQATLIEAFSEVKNDQQSVDEMKLWLLKKKQTLSWESTRATTDACYALLLRGSDWLTPTQLLQITVGGQLVKPEAAQAGTGYFKTTWSAAEIQSDQGRVTLTKPDAGVAWGALYWQYFENIEKVTAVANALSLERQLYRETRTAAGPVLEPLTSTSPLKIGDALVVRLVLRTDRALEYVHLKDQRAAGLEPISQASGYRYQNGLGYYESPRDAATNFFLSNVPRGTHVFEYRLRASQAGDFSGGLSQVQCLYAPEFGAQSAGVRLRIAP